MENHSGKKCGCGCHSVIGVFVVLFGVIFLLGNLDILSQRCVGAAWPTIIILAGITKLFKSRCKCCKKED